MRKKEVIVMDGKSFFVKATIFHFQKERNILASICLDGIEINLHIIYVHIVITTAVAIFSISSTPSADYEGGEPVAVPLAHI